MQGDLKEVYFGEYCSKCEYGSRPESSNPCWDCLEAPARQDSHKPVYFKEKETKDEKPNRTVKKQQLSTESNSSRN